MALAPERVHELTEKEAWELIERQTQRYLKMSAQQFVDAWREGRFKGEADRPAVMRIATLLSLIEP